MAPYTISSHNFTMQKVWKEASEGVCWVLLCCSSHSLLLPEQLLVELHFELCFGSSADVVFSFELDRFPRLPDLFLSTAMQKAVITPQLVLLLVLRCWEHSWLGGRNLRLSGSLLVQVWKLQYTLPVWMFAHYNKYWMLLIWNLWSHFRNVDVRVRSGCLKDGWGGGKIFTSFQYFLQQFFIRMVIWLKATHIQIIFSVILLQIIFSVNSEAYLTGLSVWAYEHACVGFTKNRC